MLLKRSILKMPICVRFHFYLSVEKESVYYLDKREFPWRKGTFDPNCLNSTWLLYRFGILCPRKSYGPSFEQIEIHSALDSDLISSSGVWPPVCL